MVHGNPLSFHVDNAFAGHNITWQQSYRIPFNLEKNQYVCGIDAEQTAYLGIGDKYVNYISCPVNPKL